MQTRNKDRYFHFIFESNNPVYLKETKMLDIVKDYPCFEINSDNQMSFKESLQKFISDNADSTKNFIIIDTNNMDVDSQKVLSYMVKDKSYQTLSLPENCKIIVVGNKDNMSRELWGLLVIVDV